MKILVTGATGYLGSNIIENFKNKFEISGLDIRNYSSENLADASVIINCIGKTGDGEKNVSYETYLESNYNSVVKLYDIFEKSNAKLLIHFSSISAVEELMSEVNLDENAECNPISDYGITKRKAEEFLLSKITKSNKKVIILRPTRIYGPEDKGTIFQLYQFLKKGIPYPFASFDNVRSFLALDNLIFLLSKMIEKKDAINSGIYNVNDDEELSTLKIIESFQKYGDIKVRKLYIPKGMFNGLAKLGDLVKLPFNSKILGKITQSRIVSNKKIKSELGIEKLPITAEEGLIKTIKNFK